MSLIQNQLDLLRTDLQRLANVEYDDVLAELLDHYASLTEQRMATERFRTYLSIGLALLTTSVQLFQEQFVYKPKLA